VKPFIIKNKFIPRGEITLAGDKSIAHRALILSALSCGKTILKNFPIHDDSSATVGVLKSLGVKILQSNRQALVLGRGKEGLAKPGQPVFTGDSGTTLRLLLGVLAGQDFKTKVTAGKYLSLRPMARVNVPLRLMGAQITARIKAKDEYAPIIIRGGNLKGITYRIPVASAQVKSAILLAALFAKGKTCLTEKVCTRDHTERMLKIFSAGIVIKNKTIFLDPRKELTSPQKIYIPGDISSAAFFIVLAAIISGSFLVIRKLGLNQSRSGIIRILKRMQAKIKITYLKPDKAGSFEPIGDLTVRASKLKGTVIYPGEIPSLIDELPIIMVASCFAQGRTIIQGVEELRVKETDRINSMVSNLKNMGAFIDVKKNRGREDIIIDGKGVLFGANLKSFSDHRTAMSMVIAALAAEGKSTVDDVGCISKSFPAFLTTLKTLIKS
jgi:3-phosphoshikimate 1-carboxyvinyltransferase